MSFAELSNAQLAEFMRVYARALQATGEYRFSLIEVSKAAADRLNANDAQLEELARARGVDALKIAEQAREIERLEGIKNSLLVAIKSHSGEDNALMGLRKLAAAPNDAIEKAAIVGRDIARAEISLASAAYCSGGLTQSEIDDAADTVAATIRALKE